MASSPLSPLPSPLVNPRSLYAQISTNLITEEAFRSSRIGTSGSKTEERHFALFQLTSSTTRIKMNGHVDSTATSGDVKMNDTKPPGPQKNSSAHTGDTRHSPFPPLPLMLNRDRTVSAAISASLLDKGKGKAIGGEEVEDHVEWARGRKGLSPGSAAKKLFPKPSSVKRLYRRFFIKRDLVYVSSKVETSFHR